METQWTARTSGGEGGSIFVCLLLKVQAESEIWYLPSLKYRLTSTMEGSRSATRPRETDGREMGRQWSEEWEHLKMWILYLLCGCILLGPLIGYMLKTSDRWPAVPESSDQWQLMMRTLDLWVAQMWAAWLKWFPLWLGTLARGSVKLLLPGNRRWRHYDDDITRDLLHMLSLSTKLLTKDIKLYFIQPQRATVFGLQHLCCGSDFYIYKLVSYYYKV